MKGLANELRTLIEEAKPVLHQLSSGYLSEKPHPAKWSKKQIIGHMIDSAQSNIRRFIIAQYEPVPHIVYNQDFWVAANDYQNWNEQELIELWFLLNRQITKIWTSLPSGAEQLECRSETVHTIEWLANDYVKHLRHHLHQVLDREPVAYP
jgi:hypothetical protein